MKRTTPTNLILAKAALIVAIGLATHTASAALADLASAPLSKSGGGVVKPNLMFLLDTSGSMDWDFMPDALSADGVAPGAEKLCKGTSGLDYCSRASEPARASALSNGIYYNPAITYTPAVKYDGSSYTNYTTWTAVKNDAFGIQDTGTTDLTTNYLDYVYCNTNSPSTADLSPPFSGACKQPIVAGVWTYPNDTGTSSTSYNRAKVVAGTNPPFYYNLTGLVWCSSRFPSGSGAKTGFGDPGGTCQVKKTATYKYPSYGSAGNNGFTRVQIVPGTTTYPRVKERTDCTGAVGPAGCSYAQEMTNFANWFAYYRTRMQMMKTASGLAFKQVNDTFRVGFVIINPDSPVPSADFLAISDFTAGAGGQKDKWYSKVYAEAPSGGTPLREALSRVGRYYAHVTTGINKGMSDDPVQYACQQNFTIMSTDGFWNGNDGQTLDGSDVDNQDSDPEAAPRPMLDGPLKTTVETSNDTYTQQICTGTANAFGAYGCSCPSNYSRVVQQKSSSITTTITIDGVLQSTTPSTDTDYAPITSCNAVVTTTVTPTTRTDEQVVLGGSATTFSVINGVTAGSNSNGVCPANYAGKIQRTTNSFSTLVNTGGVNGTATSSGASYSYTPIGACVALTNTVVTRFTVVQEETVIAAGTSSFGGISGSAGGPVIGVPAGTQVTSGCAANRARLYRRTSTYDRTVVTVGATVNAPTFSAASYGTPQPQTACVDLTTKTTVNEIEDRLCTGNTTVTSYLPAGNGVDTSPACGCTGTQTAIKSRNWTYVKTVVGTNAATYSTTTPTYSFAVACSNPNPTKTVTRTPNPTVTNTFLSQTGAPVAAATSNSNAVLSNTTGASGLTAAASTGPTAFGVPTVTSTGAAITVADFTITPNPMSETVTTTTSQAVGYPDTLADVAQYYYNTDLRPDGSLGAAVGLPPAQQDVSANIVRTQPATDKQNDTANWQHMTTFTLGLGVDGTLTYDKTYRDTDPTGDFLAIKNGTLNWPKPVGDTPTAVDDLWHAAVNGRGRYFSAKDPSELSAGLTKALTSLKATMGSSSAAATSTLQPVKGDNWAYGANFQTEVWDGDLISHPIDPATGVVDKSKEAAQWFAQKQLDILAASTTPGGNARKIKRFNAAGTNNLQDFTWANLTATEQNYFSAAWIGTGPGALSQWGSIDQVNAVGANLVNFIRGDKTNQGLGKYYRDRTHILGDIVNGAPVYVKFAQSTFVDTGYSSPAGASFADCVNGPGTSCTSIYTGAKDPVADGGARSPTVYIGANDGMLHALNAHTGDERWAYIPNILIPQLYRLADQAYVHQFYADGSPSIGDVYDTVAGKWKTILVAGLNSGGRSYYALDITDPETPIGLWEFNVRAAASCPSTTVMGVDKDDCDLGLTFGNPVITKMINGTWVVVVTSGYNNVSPGDGKGYVYVLNPITGVILKKIQAASASQASLLPASASTGSTTTPLGLGRINAWVDDGEVDNTALRMYGGDLQGNLWRFNLDAGTAYAIGQVKDPSNAIQSISTKPEMADVNGVPLIFVGTGRYLGATDVASTQVQTVYAIKDMTNGTPPSAPINGRGTTLVVQTLTNSTSPVGVRTLTSNTVDLAVKDGWRIDLPDVGERINVDMQLLLGTLVVHSNIPTPTVCEPSGTSWENSIDYKTGGAVVAGGYSGVAGKGLIVGFSPIETSDGRIVGILVKDDDTFDTVNPQFSTPNSTGRRSSWRELR